MGEAIKNHNEFDTIRFNSKQLAIKIVCNSTYGASGSRFYAYYDPDIGASITWAAREMIHDLTYVLESNRIYVDKAFIEENAKQYDVLMKYGLLTVSMPDITNDDDKPDNIIALSLRRLFDDHWNVIDYNSIIRLDMKPAKIIYQDTDSNYYVIRYLQDYFKDRYDPESINECMHLMKKHNEFFQKFMFYSIFRAPIGLGFEAAKIVARYFNVKKRYYGIEWNPDMESFLPEEAYDNGILSKDYNKYWQPGKTTLPREDGTYIDVNSHELLDNNTDFVSYMHHQNLSVTGMPLTRRDSYRFANFLNLEVYKNDLMLSRYIGDNNWKTCLKDSLEEVIHSVINSFKYQINYIENMVSDGLNNIEREYVLPVPFFRLKDYSQQAQYKPDKHNEIMDNIRERYARNGRKPIEIFERVNFVAINTKLVKELAESGKADIGKVADFAYTIDELIDDYNKLILLEDYNKLYISKSIKYETFIELYIISNLCYRHYMKALCQTLAPFALEYLKHDELIYIRENIFDRDDRKKRIAKATEDSAKELLRVYFTYGKDTFKEFDNIKKEWAKQYKITSNIKKTSQNQMRLLAEIHDIFPKYAHHNDPNVFKTSLMDLMGRCESQINIIDSALKIYYTNRFNTPSFKNNAVRKIYNIIKEHGPDAVINTYDKIQRRYYRVKWIISQLA